MTRVAPRTVTAEPAPVAAPGVLWAGTKLGRYELLHPIASGGMAQVWAAEQTGDLGFRKLIALKTIRPDFAFDPTFRSMFLDEARLASRIHHANVVEVLDLGVEGPIVFQAMTFVEGAPLSAWLNKAGANRLPLGAGLRIAIDMLHGLHAAHELCDDDGSLLGLVHRDVSPQNVLIGVDGIAKLADFGIAKAFGRSTEETSYGDVKGKLGYVATELLDGFPASPQSDLFSAGVVLWEVLTGRRLFKLQTGEDTTSARKRMSAYDPRQVVPELSERLSAIAMRALERDPFARFRSSLEMADALEEAVRAENLDATHRHVAASLDLELGSVIRELRDTIRSARKGTSGTNAAISASHLKVEPPVDNTVGPTVTVAGPTLVGEKPSSSLSAAPPKSRASALIVVVALALTVLSVMGAIVLLRTRGDADARAAPPYVEPPAASGDEGATAAPVPSVPIPPTVELDPTPAGSGSATVTAVAPHAGAQRPPSQHVRPRTRTAPQAPQAPATAPLPRFESPY